MKDVSVGIVLASFKFGGNNKGLYGSRWKKKQQLKKGKGSNPSAFWRIKKSTSVTFH